MDTDMIAGILTILGAAGAGLLKALNVYIKEQQKTRDDHKEVVTTITTASSKDTERWVTVITDKLGDLIADHKETREAFRESDRENRATFREGLDEVRKSGETVAKILKDKEAA